LRISQPRANSSRVVPKKKEKRKEVGDLGEELQGLFSFLKRRLT
jgi:hypothetical protein